MLTPRHIAAVISLSLLGLCFLTSPSYAQEADFLVFDEVDFLISDSLEPPGDDVNWQPLALPFGSTQSSAGKSYLTYWFRVKLEKPDKQSTHGLYFYRYNSAIDVFFNGEWIGGDTRRDGFQTVTWNHPNLIQIQNTNWREGENEVLIRYETTYFGGTFAKFLFGEYIELEPLYEERLLWQVTLNQWLLMFGFFVTLTAFVLWVLRRQDYNYLLFSGVSICWMLLSIHMVVYHNLIIYRIWLPLVHAGIDTWVYLLYLFLTRLMEIPARRSKPVLLGWLLFAYVWHILTLLNYWWVGAYLIHLIGILFIMNILLRITLKAIREKHTLGYAVTVATLFQIIFFLHDFTLVISRETGDWESALFLSPFAFPMMQLVFLVALLHRFVQALVEAEDLNRNLEAKVEQSRKVIEQAFIDKRRLDLERAAEEERQRIYRELHDDLGSKLLSIAHAGRGSRFGTMAMSAVESLRDALSRANHPDQELAGFLTGLQEENILRLESAGLQVNWEQPENLPSIIVPANIAFNLNRIFKEIVTNILRHSSADSVAITIRQEAGTWQFRVADNGRGFDNTAPSGNGLNNIKSRSEEIHGYCRWESNPDTGVSVFITLPSWLEPS